MKETYICESRTNDTVGWYEDIYRRCSEFAEVGAISEEKYLRVVDAITDALRKLTPSIEPIYSFPVTSDIRNENMETSVIKVLHLVNRPSRTH